MKKFVYAKKDSYSHEEVESLMEQNTKFARQGYLEKTESLTNTLNEHKAMKDAAETAEFTKGLTPKLEKLGITDLEKVLKYGNFNKDMSDDEIKAKVDGLKADFPDSFASKPKFEDSEFKTDVNEAGDQSPATEQYSRVQGNVYG